MLVDLADGTTLFAHTGGQDFDRAKPVVVLVHGAGVDHTFWRSQTRYLANHGFSVLAVDLPGHGRSGGKVDSTIGSRSEAVVGILDALDVDRAALVGHSMGSLVALDVAGRWPDRAAALVLCATNPRMAVHPTLIETAEADDDRCLELTTGWSHGSVLAGEWAPGEWVPYVNWRLTEQVGLPVFGADFVACDAWTEAPERAAAVTCPSLVVSGAQDRMTRRMGGEAMAEALGCEHVVLDAGHMLAQEVPATLTRLLTSTLTTALGANLGS